MGIGSAPVTEEVLNFSKAALGCPIPEGYGQTESTCSITFCHPFDPSIGKIKLFFSLNKKVTLA
jgi:long-chain acyl-CoA synthetase